MYEPHLTAEPASERPERVLLVEDDSWVADVMTSVLTSAGFTVSGRAEQGEEAVDLVARTQPHLVLMDVQLAGSLDGVATAHKLRENRYEGSLVYVTAYASRDLMERASRTQPHAYVLKPFASAQFLVSLQIAFARHAEERKLQGELSRAREVVARVHELTTKVERADYSDTVSAGRRQRLQELTRREHDVFLLAVRGESSDEIARALFISPHTARNHLASIYRKLEVGSRLELSTKYTRFARHAG